MYYKVDLNEKIQNSDRASRKKYFEMFKKMLINSYKEETENFLYRISPDSTKFLYLSLKNKIMCLNDRYYLDDNLCIEISFEKFIKIINKK